MKIFIVHDRDEGTDMTDDLNQLSEANPETVKIKYLNMPKLLKNGGVMHSKLLVVDRMHFYLGSANLSDRGLSHRRVMDLVPKTITLLVLEIP